MATTGWTFEKGGEGERVREDTTIYSSTSCLSIIKTGKDKEKSLSDLLEVDEKEAAEIIDEQKQQEDAYYNAKAALQTRLSSLYADHTAKYELYKASVKEWNAYVKKYNNADDATKLTMDAGLTERKKKMEDASAAMDAVYKKIQKEESDFKAVWGDKAPQLSNVAAQHAEPEIVKYQKDNIDKLAGDLEENVDVRNKTPQPVSNLLDWFVAIEEYVDNLPQYREEISQLYEVVQKGNWWEYTGITAVADPAYNKAIREWKQKQCQKLNNMMASVTKEVEKFLNDQAKKCTFILPLIAAIEVIQGGVSIDTLVKWGKGVINFCTGIYNMFFMTYQTIMGVMEILVIRFPQLISKIIDKITEFDCPVTFSSIKITVKKEDIQRYKENKEAEKKAKKNK